MRRAGRALATACAALGAVVLLAGAGDGDTFHWPLPPDLPPPAVPAANPMTPDKVALGRHLFHDPRLSADGTQSCATCHRPERAFTEDRPTSVGVTGQRGPRNAPTLANVAYLPVLTWHNPLLTTLEVQALIPLFGEHPVELGLAGREAELFARLQAEPRYRHLFAQAFPAEAAQGDAALFTLATVTRALAAFQRTLLSTDSPWDRHRRSDPAATLTPAQQRGAALFFGDRLACQRCHAAPHFTDNLMHTGLAAPRTGFHRSGVPTTSAALAELTGRADDAGRVRTPTLRNVAVTAPYLHDGSVPTLTALLRRHPAAGLTEAEIADLVAFLDTLTDARFLAEPAYRSPWCAPPDAPLTSLESACPPPPR